MSVSFLQSNWWERESSLFYFNCVFSVMCRSLLCAPFSGCFMLYCGLWLWHFMLILTLLFGTLNRINQLYEMQFIFVDWHFCNKTKYQVSMIRKYHNHKLQTNPWHHGEEPQNNHNTPGSQKIRQPALFSAKMISKLEWSQSNVHQNIEQLQNPTTGVTINN